MVKTVRGSSIGTWDGEKVPNWECLFVHRKQELFLSENVDAINKNPEFIEHKDRRRSKKSPCMTKLDHGGLSFGHGTESGMDHRKVKNQIVEQHLGRAGAIVRDSLPEELTLCTNDGVNRCTGSRNQHRTQYC